MRYNYCFVCAMIDHYSERYAEAKTIEERKVIQKTLVMYQTMYESFA